jgi:hypothetical protein
MPFQDQFDNVVNSDIAYNVHRSVGAVATCVYLSPIQTTPTGSAAFLRLIKMADLAIYKA